MVLTYAQTTQSQREQAELSRKLQEMVRCLYAVVVLKPGLLYRCSDGMLTIRLFCGTWL